MMYKILSLFLVLSLWSVRSTCLLAAEADWLAKYVPPKFEGGTPFTIKKVDVSRNHVDQELITAEYERTPEVIRTLPKEIKLVILPVGGGRYEAWANEGIGISPQQSGKITGITDSLLDYRGKIPGGARAYIEMTVANVVKKQDPVRISNMFWIGTPEQLKAAQKSDPADPNNAELKPFAVKTVPDDALVPAGMPIRFAGGTHWYRGNVMKQAVAGKPLEIVVYLAKPGGLYLPWYVVADRTDVKVETAALDAAKSDATYFADRFRELKAKIGQGNAPNTLKHTGEKITKGDRVLWFGFHGLMSGEAQANSADDKVKVIDDRFKQEAVLEVGQLYVDPELAGK